MDWFVEQALGRDHIAQLRAEATHDALVRACLERNREGGAMANGRWGLVRRWVRRARVPDPSPAD